MIALLLRIAAPMQSWGTQSRFVDRETQLEPTKSGVVGLLCAALGLPRDPDSRHASGITLRDLAELPMAVRVDREGKCLRDYHTVGGGSLSPDILSTYGLKKYGVSKSDGSSPEPAVTQRYYLADARFLVAMGGPEKTLLTLADALRDPVFPIFFGRKSFVPSEPVLHDVENPLRKGESFEDILRKEPWTATWAHSREYPRRKREEPQTVRLVLESATAAGSPRADNPLSYEKGNRRHLPRYVCMTTVDVGSEQHE